MFHKKAGDIKFRQMGNMTGNEIEIWKLNK